jgi:mannose-1-phosphate guanylyltransferase/mannose-6-phosphate isomerase
MTAPVHPFILSGGAGTRLWPASSAAMPKQLLALTSQDTLLQETLRRFVGSAFRRPVVICSAGHAAEIRRQVASLGGVHLITEPEPRSTAAAAVVAATHAAAVDPDALVLLAPADHHIDDPAAFRACLLSATEDAARGAIVTFGITPTAPETGYGYIRAPGEGTAGRPVVAFTEKPDRATAAGWLAEGGHFWNSGIFLFRADMLTAEARQLAPDIARFAAQAVHRASVNGDTTELDAASFARCPSISIDYALMERTDRAVMVPATFPWSDVGTWEALWRLGAKGDERAVVTVGDVVAEDCSGTLLRAEEGGPRITALGVEGLVVVATHSDVLILPRTASERVRDLAARRDR